MTAPALSSGRGVRIAVIDSGVHAAHPHVNGVAGGVGFDADGRQHDTISIASGTGRRSSPRSRTLAPDVEIFAVKVFDRQLATPIGCLVRAIEWAAAAGMHIANLSLWTSRREHEAALHQAIDIAAAHQMLVVAAREDEGVSYLPGSLAGALPVEVDWACSRREYRIVTVNGVDVLRTSGLPREIPGVPRGEETCTGVSFAVANASAFAARVMEGTGIGRCRRSSGG